MIDVQNNIISLTDFKRQTSEVIKRVKENKTAAVLTVNGAASVVVVDADAYQKMAQDAQAGAVIRGIEAGIQSMNQNKGIPAHKAFEALRENIHKRIKQQG